LSQHHQLKSTSTNFGANLKNPKQGGELTTKSSKKKKKEIKPECKKLWTTFSCIK